MPIWAILLIRYGVPLILKSGILNATEEAAVQAWAWAKLNIKTIPEYEETDNQKKAEALSPGGTNMITADGKVVSLGKVTPVKDL